MDIKVLRNAINAFGYDNQVNVAIEEMSELIKELCKWKRCKRNYDHIAEEIADVEIMILQLKMIFENPLEVEGWKEKKVRRLAEKLKEGDFDEK